ncbi:MAG: gliding motility-associated C-terminal domain-containing protein, partial [Bacteroidota bacterium]
FGDFTGMITVSASGGTQGYQYSLDGINFFSFPIFQSLGAGSYQVTVRDANGCTETTTVIGITEPNQPLNITVDSLRNTNCNVSLGEIWASFGGGTPGYCISLDGGMTCQDTGYFDNLTPGLYQVLITDTLGCTATDTANILEIADPFLDIDSITHVSCFGDSNGTIAVTPFEGTPPYEFSLNGGPLTSDTVYTGLPAGFYVLELFDGIGCKYGLSFFIQQPDSLYGIPLNVTDLTCAGDFTGSITVQGLGGTAPYLYALPPGIPGTDSTFSGLAAGLQTVEITDAMGCDVDLDVLLSEPVPLQALLGQKDDISCFGETDGFISVAPQGGNGGYSYSFNGSPFVQDSTFGFLAAGMYSITVMDAEGCTDSIMVEIIEPQPVGVQVIDITNVDCFDAATGTVTVQGSGGTLPYSFSFDSVNFVNNNTLEGLRAGSYAILLRDARGCQAQTNADITEPDEMIGDIDVQPVTCFGFDDGQATANVTGGTPGYTYDWSNGATGMMVNNLEPGNHIVLVTDRNGCELSLTTEVLEPPQMMIDSTDFADASCFGLADGFALAFADGGNPPYTWDWSNGATDSVVFDLAAGTYDVAITDTNGCVLQDTFLIGEPPAIEIEVVDVVDATCGLPTGEITVVASGGVEGFTYTWATDPPQFGPTATELLGGPDIPPYTVFAIDSNSCVQDLVIPLDISGLPEAAFTHNFAPLDTFLLLRNQEIQFQNLSENAAFYSWEFGDGRLSTDEDPLHVYEDLGTFEVQLIAFDLGLACPDTARLSITLLPPGAIYVANAFTPNGDGVNEAFFPVGIGVEEVEMQIFTRWGPLVTTLYSMEDRWDGTFKGAPAPEGVYVWKLFARLNDGREVNRVGTVTLYR